MRASSLSNAKVIELLNGYFVPVYLRNQDFSEFGTASPLEKAEQTRIYQSALKAGLPAGSVCVYLLTPAAQPVDTAPLNRPAATNPERMVEKLSQVVRDLNTTKGDSVVSAKLQSRPAAADSDSLVLHLTSRYLQRVGDNLVRIDTSSVLGTQKGCNWADLPSEDWIVLNRAEWTKLLPTDDVHVGQSWELDPLVATKLLKRFFPPTENTDFEKNKIDMPLLRAQVKSINAEVIYGTVEGRLQMSHSFYHQPDSNVVESELRGYFEFDVAKKRFRTLRIVTHKASYGGKVSSVQPFGVALQSVH